MNLRQYLGKKVRVVDIDDIVYIGKINLYTSANDNDVNEPAIAIYSAGIWLDESDIKSIEILEN